MYRKVLAEQPECGEAVHFLGMAAARRGKMEEAARESNPWFAIGYSLVPDSLELDRSRAC
jgi:hypothetical protein